MKGLSFIILYILLGFTLPAQTDVRERVYTHLNSQTLISGETLYMSVYCNSLVNGKPSPLSKVLYVEIIGKEGPIHQQKIELDKGRGHSDFFISSVIPSGQYHLIAYTRWMKNFGDYFHCPVLIINPYESYPNREKSLIPEITFYPVGDPVGDLVGNPAGNSVIANLENTIGYHLKIKNPELFKGRLVNNEGEVIQHIRPDKYGIGKFTFTPVAEQRYQVILEDTLGQISFHEFPAVKVSGGILTYHEGSGQFSFNHREGPSGSSESLDLSILARGDVVYTRRIGRNEDVLVSKTQLPDGLLTIQILDLKGDLLAERDIMWFQNQVSRHHDLEQFGKRERIESHMDLLPGSYSVSVRKKIHPQFDNHTHVVWENGLNGILNSKVPPIDYLSHSVNDPEALLLVSEVQQYSSTPEKVSWLPEARETILTGTISDSLGNPVGREKVALAFPGYPYQLRVGESKPDGSFFIPYQSPSSDYEAFLTGMDFNTDYTITVDDPFLDEYPSFNFQLPRLDSLMVSQLIERSIRNQIENAYYVPTVSKETVSSWEMKFPFYDSYALDAYNRFSTLKETFTEYITSANVRGWREQSIKTTYPTGIGQKEYPPLVLLDGVPVKGREVLQLDPFEVEKIRVLPNQYYLGPLTVDGIIDLVTKDRRMGGFQPADGYTSFMVRGVRPPADYSFPEYSGAVEDHLPDQRDQLFWLPDLRVDSGGADILFYASDVPGEYEIVVEGFTNEGKPVSVVQKLLVK